MYSFILIRLSYFVMYALKKKKHVLIRLKFHLSLSIPEGTGSFGHLFHEIPGRSLSPSPPPPLASLHPYSINSFCRARKVSKTSQRGRGL